MENRFNIPAILALVALLAGCGGKEGCPGPELPLQQLNQAKNSLFSGSSRGALVIPNPIEAARVPNITATDSRLSKVAEFIGLPALAGTGLENDFLRVRIRGINDSADILARPNSGSDFNYVLTDVHYSETMAYYGVQSMIEYVERLGFSVVQSRPLYVMVRAESDIPGEVNAIYDHNYLNPQAPRTMRLFGDTDFAPGMDRDMYWHEFGHLFNESVSREVGFDYAGDNGAVFTEGAALHECLADILAQSVSDNAYIGRWIARNLDGFSPGEPLRQAVDGRGAPMTYDEVAIADGQGFSPARYGVAEWCTRVLWDIRREFVNEDPEQGAMRFERLVFSAVSNLKRDTSLRAFKSSLMETDDALYCGGHETGISSAFSARGFPADISDLGEKLFVAARPVGLVLSGEDYQIATPRPGATLTFDLRLGNPNNDIARDVRVYLEVEQEGIYTTTYMQGFGDLKPGQQIEVGDTGLDYGFSVWGEIDQRLGSGTNVRYQIRITSQNTPDGVFQGSFTL